MAKFNASKTAEAIPYPRFARNTLAPSAQLYSSIGRVHNHVLAHRRKSFGTFCMNYTSPFTATTSGWPQFFWYGKTGKGVSHIECRVALARGTAANQYGNWSITNVDTASTTAGETIRTAGSASASSRLDDFSFYTTRFAVSEETTYSGVYYPYSQVPVMAAVYEIAPRTYDTEDATYMRESFAEGAPIWDTHRQAAYDTAFDLWKHNGAHMIAWCAENDGVATAIGGTETNVIDLTSTTVSSSTPGWTIDLTYRNTLNRTTVPCIFAAYVDTVGGGAAVKLKNSGGTLATLSSLSAGWNTVAVNLSTSTGKVDVHGNNCEVYAVSLFQWEA